MPIENIIRVRIRYVKENDNSRPNWVSNVFYNVVMKQIKEHIIVKQEVRKGEYLEASRVEYDCLDDLLTDMDIWVKYSN